jgi:hypothetical protein
MVSIYVIIVRIITCTLKDRCLDYLVQFSLFQVEFLATKNTIRGVINGRQS